VPVDRVAYRAYARILQAEADRYGLDLAGLPLTQDDYWRDKIDLLLVDPVPLVSFTFGIPDPAVIKTPRALGTFVVQTITSADEARQPAGGHSGTFKVVTTHPAEEIVASPWTPAWVSSAPNSS
jgi:NAD(P)H-dependent flavin oxidoreductase YrpB (nitropropane dioxygenase family)